MTIDTNILIAYFGGEISVIDQMTKWGETGTNFFISTVAESEFLAFAEFSENQFQIAQKFLSDNFTILF